MLCTLKKPFTNYANFCKEQKTRTDACQQKQVLEMAHTLSFIPF